MDESREDWLWGEAPNRHILSEQHWSQVATHLSLSDREVQVCQFLLDGRTREAIADELGIKYRTVRQYLEQLHEKLHVKNRIALVLRIIQVRDLIVAHDQQSKSNRVNGLLPNDSSI